MLLYHYDQYENCEQNEVNYTSHVTYTSLHYKLFYILKISAKFSFDILSSSRINIMLACKSNENIITIIF